MIRRLEHKDASLMLEWMHEKDINRAFRQPFGKFTAENAVHFIDNSFTDKNRHFAVVNESDEYLGTVSLKNISQEDRSAEYAIIVRSAVRGTGAARLATENILNYAFDTLGLHRVYLNVLEQNERARHFYAKCGFVYEGTSRDAILLNGRYESLAWYGIINDKEQDKDE
ncbi:MAG: GNAT family N-acetyltransferase [Lachnospiraceae bacterium]|nr:GNAT family N-acetyltransferase [Lachnospiraceae bacterium]